MTHTRRKVCLLGATGSIGQSCLDLIAEHPTRFALHSASAHSDVEGMVAIVARFRPAEVAMSLPEAARTLADRLRAEGYGEVRVHVGPTGLAEIAADPATEMVVAGIVGIAGLASVWAAAQAGKTILLANKEALVCAGGLLVALCAKSGATVLPIDSEHNAIFQCLGLGYRCFSSPPEVLRLLLTASGGPFRTWEPEAIRRATVAQAVKHPNWSMGQKISVDSATMMNKGLEWIEAHWLFSMPMDQIQIVVHPESIIHSMVAYSDGSTLAQLGAPDMRTPIAHAMAWPQRMSAPSAALDWTALKALHFETPDPVKFPALRLVPQAMSAGASATICLNAANEGAVDAFLRGAIPFGAITDMVEQSLDSLSGRFSTPDSLEEVLEVDAQVRRGLQSLLSSAGSRA
ncbi:MAG: 1-deoxy-D-xylulose 5-phosphate reductoisomerase [Pseudomonadota bacterium]|jgi:1-deoxy-D-xylulose-5-phosphate reductoisomerase